MDKLYEKILGSLIGISAGDAMGMPTSMLTPEQIKKYYGYVDDFVKPMAEHLIHEGLEEGSSTDDTIMTMLVADELIEQNGNITIDGMVQKLIKWALDNNMLESPIIGPSTRSSLKTLINGGDPIEAGKFGETNGAAMKIAPIGLVNYNNLDLLQENVYKACVPSHGTSTAISGAMAVSYAIASAMRGDGIDKIIKESIKGAEIGVKMGNIVPAASVARRIELAIELVDSSSSEEEAATKIYEIIGTSMRTIESVPAAMGFFYLAKGNPKKAILIATNMGDDADTISSITGGISGAYSGIKDYPKHWIDVVYKSKDADILNRSLKLYNLIK